MPNVSCIGRSKSVKYRSAFFIFASAEQSFFYQKEHRKLIDRLELKKQLSADNENFSQEAHTEDFCSQAECMILKTVK